MANYRKFSLVNGTGATLSLIDDKKKIIGIEPTGLGFSKSTSTLRIGNESVLTYEQDSLQNIELRIIFYGTNKEIYKNYQDFVDFVSVEPLYLLYEKPDTSNVFRRLGYISSLGKSEISTDNYMACPMVFTTQSFWEDNIERSIVASSSQSGEGKSYPLTRPYFYAKQSINDMIVNSTGGMETPLKIEISGATTNPSYSLFDANGKQYGLGKLLGTYDKITIDSDDTDETIYLESGGVATDNPYNYQDLSIGDGKTQLTFLKVRSGENKIVFNLGTTFDGEVKVSWRNRYLSV